MKIPPSPVAVTSGTVKSGNSLEQHCEAWESSSMWGSWENLHLWNKFRTHCSSTSQDTSCFSENTILWEVKWFRFEWYSSPGFVENTTKINEAQILIFYSTFLQTQSFQPQAVEVFPPNELFLPWLADMLSQYCSVTLWNALLLQLFSWFVWKMKNLLSFLFFLG